MQWMVSYEHVGKDPRVSRSRSWSSDLSQRKKSVPDPRENRFVFVVPFVLSIHLDAAWPH